ncbi:hypothetical protein SKAU_G00427370 [Synaphobranchus kaupii]|uniref:Uncharacterized protein n=1 Tax=Synaphobranchus kaupii TaxID=118154 RepID=A0A9Q1E4U9_SYNKA|nr:hypothetical protein SKAU_G00427370 [Synaphobranchus kaupii]
MSGPSYIVYTDGDLERARSAYFEQKRLGTEHSMLSKELFCRLIRHTMTNMVSIARVADDSRYPSRFEVDAMAKRLVEYYPMLSGGDCSWPAPQCNPSRVQPASQSNTGPRQPAPQCDAWIAVMKDTMNLPSSPQSQSPSNQNVTIDPTQLKVVVQPESRPPPLFRGDQSEPFSIHEWEDMMKGYMSRVACSSDSERAELIMSRLAGRARDVKVSLRSRPRVCAAELPTMIFDILKRNFSELTYSSMPMKDFYESIPRDFESAMDYWVRLNKVVDVADECLRRRGKTVEDPSAEVVMMFITHCPDPSLAVSFQFKPVELWTAAEVQE